MIVAATGHRLGPKLGGYDTKTRRALGALAVQWLHYNRPETLISGMALGWDQAVAGAAVTLDIPFVAAIPFEGQESRWPAEAQARYRRLLGLAAEVVNVDLERATQDWRSATQLLQDRNRWMVDRAGKMLALWDGTMGGTHNCLVYAKKKGVEVANLWLDWSLPDDVRELLS